jgi:heme exporter protein CcmD
MDVDALVQWAAMGKHGLYVWLAYGTTLLTLCTLVWQTRHAATQIRREIGLEIAIRERETR